MSSLGQLSTRLDRHLQIVGELTKAVLALRAKMTGKLEALKLSEEDVVKARGTIATFLTGLIPALSGATQMSEDHRIILEKLQQSGEQPSDWAEDFGEIVRKLEAAVEAEPAQLEKIMHVVGYLQGEVAEDVRRLRSR